MDKGVKSIFGIDPHMVQNGLVISYIDRVRLNVVTAKQRSVGINFTAVTQLFPVRITRLMAMSCREETALEVTSESSKIHKR
jgi:hypothetical protein